MEPGTVAAGRFEIERLAGRGGMGSVYRARDRATGSSVALKLLHHAGQRERFEREAQILATLNHRNIVRYVAHGTTDGQQPYLVIEWLDGEDLLQRLAREPLGVRESLVVVRQMADALGAAHACGVVHRDVKPSNVYLLEGNLERVKLLDFGIARLGRASRSLTTVGLAIGTPDYMAPEQARGDAALDARADVFALGCVLFECLTGRPPFVGDHVMAVLAKILLEDAPRPSDLQPGVPAAVDELVARMLAKQPEERPLDGAAVVQEIAALQTASDEGSGRPVVRSARSELGEGEQRVVQVVLAATRRGDPEAPPSEAPTLSIALSDSEERMRRAAEAHGARFEPLADGSVVAVIAPADASWHAAATDQAARAARCALAMRAADGGAPMAMATGRAVLGSRWPIGPAIDRAARMLREAVQRAQVAADRGVPAASGVWIDDATVGLVGPELEVRDDGDALELLGRREQREEVRFLLGRPTPCVGREAELASLEAFIGRCFEQPAGGAVLITGAPGVGKSRLRHELGARLRATPETASEVWIGRGDPMSAGSPFGLLSSALQQAAGLRAGESLSLRRARLRGRVARHVAAADVERVAEFLGELCGTPFADDDRVQLHAARQDAALMGDQMLRAWLDFVRAECAAHPVLLVLEDLHWGDAPTVRLVDAALRHTASLPFVALALGRDEVDTTFGELWATRALMRVRLGQLSAAAGLLLVRDVLGDGPSQATAERLVERAAGNPFYLEELLRAVAQAPPLDTAHADTDAPQGASAARRPRAPAVDAPESLPETVVAMVATRLGAEDPENRRVLRAASLFGQIFWSGGVAALVGGVQRTASVRDRLGDLVARELIVPRSDSRLAGQKEYSFRHGLVRDAAYAMLTDEDRVLGHRLAGDWLEQRGEASAIALAEHFYRGGEGGRAVRWFRRAAEQALEGGDFAAALHRARHGIDCGAVGEISGALHLLLAEAHRFRGELVEAESDARAAAELLAGGSAAWFRATEHVIDASGRRGDYASASEWQRRAADAAASGDARAAQVVCLCSAARQSFHAGRYQEASALGERVDHLAIRISDPRALAEAHRLRGARARHVGDLAGDVTNYQRSLEAFEQAGDARSAANARVSLGFSCIELGDFDRAKDHLEEALAEAERLGLATVSTRARQNLALVRAARNELEEAERLVSEVIEESHAAGNVRFEGWTRIYLSFIAHRAGDAVRAEREADQAARMLAVTPPARAGALASRARALLSLRRIEEARASADEAMKVLEAFGGIEEFESSVWLAAAETARARGDRAAADRIISAARDRLLSRAGAIGQPGWRKSFLSQVPDNARILSLARAWLRDD